MTEIDSITRTPVLGGLGQSVLINPDPTNPEPADATLLAEAPRIASFRSEMENNLAAALKIDATCMNVKATTTEGLGFVGRGLGIAAQCVVLIQNKSDR